MGELVNSLTVWISRLMLTVRLCSYGILESLKMANETLGKEINCGYGPVSHRKPFHVALGLRHPDAFTDNWRKYFLKGRERKGRGW